MRLEIVTLYTVLMRYEICVIRSNKSYIRKKIDGWGVAATDCLAPVTIYAHMLPDSQPLHAARDGDPPVSPFQSFLSP